MTRVLERFPKKRPELPDAIKAIYDEYMKINREGNSTATSAAVQLEAWMHKKVAEDIKDTDYQGETLEIGAGTLIQLNFESPARAMMSSNLSKNSISILNTNPKLEKSIQILLRFRPNTNTIALFRWLFLNTFVTCRIWSPV